MTRPVLGAVLPGELTQARLELHWAAQLVSAAGTSLLPAEEDFSHTNLGWDPRLGALVGHDVGAKHARAALVFDGLGLVVIEGERERASLRLSGRTLSQALAWLGSKLAGDDAALGLPVHDMPAYPVGEGAVFSDEGAAARTELAGWFEEAFASIGELAAREDTAAPVRCWPHHFDVASLITLDTKAGAEEPRSIGRGLLSGRRILRSAVFLCDAMAVPRGQGSSPAGGRCPLAYRRVDGRSADSRACDFGPGAGTTAYDSASACPQRRCVP